MARSFIAVTLLLAAGCTQSKSGILIMAHGGDETWNREVEEVVSPLREEAPTEIAFGMATPSTIEAAIRRLEARGVDKIHVVRMFISGESFLAPTEYILGLRADLPDDPHAAHAAAPATHAGHHAMASDGPSTHGEACPESGSHASSAKPSVGSLSLSEMNDPAGHASHSEDSAGHDMEPPRRIQTTARIIMSRDGVADSPLVDQILIDRVRALSREPARESILILGHGPGDDGENERWLSRMSQRAQQINQLGRFRHIRCETLREDWPEKRAAAEQRIRRFVEEGNRDGGRVIVVPFRVSGFGPYKEVLNGLTYVADGRGFCPHPNMTRWLRETAERMAVTR